MTESSADPVSDPPMIRCAEKSRSRDEVMDRALRAGAGLAALGVRQGDRVAIVLRNDVEFIEASLAIGLFGAVPVPVNWHWKGAELGYLLDDCGATAAFVHSDLIELVREAASRPIPIIEVAPSPALRAAYGIDPASEAHGETDLETLVAQNEPLATPATPPLGIIYSSGTTGKPKGIQRGTMTPSQSRAITERVFQAMGLRAGVPTMVTAPLYHSAPNAQALFAAVSGFDVTIMPRFEPEEFLATVQRHRIGHAQAVPTMFIRLLQLPKETRERYDVSTLVSVVTAAAPCPIDVKRKMIDWWGPVIVEYYGGTETGTVVFCDSTAWLAHPGTVGKAMPGCAVKILLPDGTEAPTRTSGEIYIDSGSDWPGFTYIGQAAKRAEVERDGYVTVGDAGWLDEEGYLYLSDRIADMVISGGVNIYPVEIEQHLLTLDGVRDVAVFGIPDDEFGEALAAHVDTDPESGLTEDDIREHVRAGMANYKVPRVVVIDHDLPREESGKLFKRKIRQRYWPA